MIRYKTLEDYMEEQIETTTSSSIFLMVHLVIGVIGSFIIIPNEASFKHATIDLVADKVVPFLLLSTVFMYQNSKAQVAFLVVLLFVHEL